MADAFPHNHSAVLFFLSLLLTLWLTPLVVRLAFRIGAVDRPDGRKIHLKAVSRLGGVAMVAGLILPLALFREMDRGLAGFLAGAVVVSALGFLDDVFRIRPALKFAGEVLAAAVFVLVSGVALTDVGDFLGLGTVHTGGFAPAVTVFCMVGVMNALNLSDGLDGLAGGISATACLFLGTFAYTAGDWVSLSILVALCGAVVGFLRYNTHPANVFMGDTGSLLLGYSLSAVAVLLARDGGTGMRLSPVTVAGILALPITDTLLVMFRRLWHHRNPFHPDRTHLHHRLMDLGVPHAATVPILYVSTALFGFQAWFHRFFPEGRQFLFIVLLAAVVHGSVFLAHRRGLRWRDEHGKRIAFSTDGPNRLIASLLEKSVVPMGWMIGAALFLPAAILGSVPPPMAAVALAAAGFLAVLFPWRSRRSRSAVCYGLVYTASVCFLGILQLSPGAPRWVPGYLAALSALVLFWVLLKMRYRGNREIVLFSSYEMLLIGGSLFVPFVLVSVLGMGEGIRRTALTVCLESVSLLLAIKIFIRRRPARHFVFASWFLVALLVLGMKGFLNTTPSETRLSGGTPGVIRTSGVPQAARLPARAAIPVSPIPSGVASASSPGARLSPVSLVPSR